MKPLALLLLCALAYGAESVVVKPLSETQRKALKAASEKLAKAEEEYGITVRGIKAAFGDSSAMGVLNTDASCTQTGSSVELVANTHAVIRTETINVCVMDAVKPID